MARVLIDTSAVYALLDRDDTNHAAAKACLEKLRRLRTEPWLTNFVLGESHALLLARLGHEVARKWLLANTWPVERVTVEDEERARDIIRRQADQTYSYVDATSFAVMERLRIRRALAFDRHFQRFGFELCA